MKAGLATSLSIVGVLATGAAALALNSSILDTESSAKGSPAFATVVGLETPGAITPLGGDSSGAIAGLSANGVADAIGAEAAPVVTAATSEPSTTSTTTSDTDSSSTTSSLPTPVEKQFKVGDAAVITLAIDGTKLIVKDISITPGSGYEVTRQFSNDGDDVRITLTSPMRAVEFSARLTNGQIMAAVSTPGSGNLNEPRPPRHHDDDHDDHDDRGEREHDDEHEEREHEEHEEREHDDDD